jgi:hypothetical protein
MFQQFSSTRSSLCTSDFREDVGLTVHPTMFFSFSSRSLKIRKIEEREQNEEERKVKTKKPSRNVLDFLFSCPETPRVRRRCKVNSNPD